eukprot:403332293
METLLDPCRDRKITEVNSIQHLKYIQVPLPPHRPLDSNLLFPNRLNGLPDWEQLRNHLKAEGRIRKADFMRIIKNTKKLLEVEPNMILVNDPVCVFGDIHGHFYDLINIFTAINGVQDFKLLFLGDYVDRGPYSVEVIMFLYALKLYYPKKIYLLRGNHESRLMSQHFTFRDEVLSKYDQEVFNAIIESFENLPLACLVNGKYFCIHGGISPKLKSIQNLNSVNRKQEIPESGSLCDLLWADPVQSDNGTHEEKEIDFVKNQRRGCSVLFGKKAVNTFLQTNQLVCVIRAHEVQQTGYKFHKWNGASNFPTVITVFSAPNYCDVYNNKSAIIKISDGNFNIKQFNYTHHPYMLPKNMDVFTWSLPFVFEKVQEMLEIIVKKCALVDEMEDDDEEEEQKVPSAAISIFGGGEKPKPEGGTKSVFKRRATMRGVLSHKILFLSKVSSLLKRAREKNESMIKIHGMCPDKHIPDEFIGECSIQIKDSSNHFFKASKYDKENEMRPYSMPR